MKIKDPRYDYHITVSAHVILQNKKKEILFTRRPDTWEWAPGRWALPGGKLYKEESFAKAIKRKTKQELGFEVMPDGLYQVKQLIIKDKQAFMYFFIADYNDQKFTGEMVQYEWFNKNTLKKMSLDTFAEYFYKDMFQTYLTGKVNILPMNKIDSLNYIKLENTKKYKKWFKDIINKSYDPGKIDDFKKWENRQKLHVKSQAAKL